MGTLERYLLRQTLGPLGFFTLVLTGVVWLTQSLRIIDIVVNNGQGARVFLEFTLLLLPTVLSIVLQLSALGATVYMLHRLITESELAAAFAGGFSKLALARPIVILGLGLTALLAVDTLYLMPTSARIMRDRLAEVRGDIAAGLIRDGRFLTPAAGLTVYIREITPRGEMLGVLVEDSSDAERGVVTYTAKKGFLAENGGKTALLMMDGQAQQYDPRSKRLSLLSFERLSYDLSGFMDREGERYRKPSERYFWELIDPPEAAKLSKKGLGKLLAEGHEQLSAPLYGLALPLVATAVLLGAGFSRRGVTGAVILAVGLGAALRVGGVAIKNALTGAPWLWPLLYLLPLLGIAAALYALWRSPMPRAARAAPPPSHSRSRPAGAAAGG